MTPEKRMTKIRTRLLLDRPWWGSLGMRLKFEADSTIKTLATNGESVFYSPEFIATIGDDQLVAEVAHEIMHCAMLHPYRRGNRDMEDWNVSCDLAINPILKKAGFTLGKDWLLDPQFDGMAAETIYAKRQKQKQDNGGKQPGGAKSRDEVQDAPKPDPGNGKPADGEGAQRQPQGMTEHDWKVAVEQANMVSKKAGNLPEDAARAARAARESEEDWIAVLREFIQDTVPSDYSWTTPNRRFIADGLYLPGIVKENTGRIAIAVDTSGSINQEMLSRFASEISAIVSDVRPEAVDVLYCDCRVKSRESFSPDDGDVVLAARGGGGTAFKPVFDALAADDEQPKCLLYFSDLENGREKLTEPEYPVLWVTGSHVTAAAPNFGRVLRIDAFGSM